MLTFLGFAMLMTFMYLIMSKCLSALLALLGGFAAGIGPMMLFITACSRCWPQRPASTASLRWR